MDAPWVLQARNLSKSFPGVAALTKVCLDIEPGKVHALMGENGAGKSTLMKVLSGHYAPDEGEVIFRGQRVKFSRPHDALCSGIAMIHQELLLFPELTVAENIFMGQEPVRRFPGWVDRRRMAAEAGRVLNRLGAAFSPRCRLRELSVAQMQTVEIAKALTHRARVVMMDEPTSALSEPEVRALLRIIGDLKQDGVAILYTSHKLEEVFRAADVVSVLLDGRHVGTYPIGQLDHPQLIRLMVGRELSAGNLPNQVPAPPTPAGSRSELALAVRGLSKRGRFKAADFGVRRGEILGIAGLMGAGRTELVSSIFGLTPADAGEIYVEGKRVRIGSPKEAIRQGLAMVTEDRHRLGLILPMSVRQNLTLSNLRACCRAGFIHARSERAAADRWIRNLSIKTPGQERAVRYLSGGNQQKIVLAKGLFTEPRVLLLDEPTRGIDVGAKAEVYTIIKRLASEGKAIIMVSSELPELLSMSDRILVLRAGEITAELDARRTTQEEILKHAMPG